MDQDLDLVLDQELVLDLVLGPLDTGLDLKPIFSTPEKPAAGEPASWFDFKCTLSDKPCDSCNVSLLRASAPVARSAATESFIVKKQAS